MSYVVNVVGGFVAFMMILVWIVGTIWVLVDARSNSSQSAILWGLVAFFGGVLGLLLYVLLGRNGADSSDPSDLDEMPGRSDAELSHRCQSCGEEYYTNPSSEIGTCRKCGGIKVTRVGS